MSVIDVSTTVGSRVLLVYCSVGCWVKVSRFCLESCTRVSRRSASRILLYSQKLRDCDLTAVTKNVTAYYKKLVFFLSGVSCDSYCLEFEVASCPFLLNCTVFILPRNLRA